MRFVFSGRFYLLLALGIVPLSLSWEFDTLRYGVIAYDILLAAAAIIDFVTSRHLPDGFVVRREFEKRFAIGDPVKVSVLVENGSTRKLDLVVKDEYPPEMHPVEAREAEFSLLRPARMPSFIITSRLRGGENTNSGLPPFDIAQSSASSGARQHSASRRPSRSIPICDGPAKWS